MIRRLLIANRGEIVRRIARTCRGLGIEHVAVYSEADAAAPHLAGAVAAVCLGPAPAADSYLRSERVIAAALESGCDAVHPGYGFLSENAAFAQAVIDAGLTFVGPAPETIAAMGDKATAKHRMAAAGVPVVPGASEASDDPAEIADRARALGLPVLLKPAAGGGGKGMTVVAGLDALQTAVESGLRLARASFGDARLLVERYLPRPRHVEVQVFGDHHGQVVHLYERECSLQRRHQKIVEEAPAPGLPDEVRQRLLATAVQGARAIGYRNAGTFEFLLDADGRFYFLEVNTRLQVEHPVTEAITGLDLVEWQLRVAAGEPLPLTQEQIAATGHAVECRIYAEDAAAGFRPAPGRVRRVAWPPGVRIESAIEDGTVIPPHYDPMVAKLVAQGADRAQALAAARRALAETRLFGLTTNVDFLLRLLADSAVTEGRVDTGHVDDHLARLVGAESGAKAAACAGALALLSAPAADGGGSPWLGSTFLLDRTALDPEAPLGRLMLSLAGARAETRLLARGQDWAEVAVAVARGAESDRLRVTGVRGGDGLWRGAVGESSWGALALDDGLELVIDGRRVRVDGAAEASGLAEARDLAAVAPMPGVVVAVRTRPGERVTRGQVLLVVEAMKMENPVLSPADGVVAEVRVALGASVTANQVLALLSPPEAPQHRGVDA